MGWPIAIAMTAVAVSCLAAAGLLVRHPSTKLSGSFMAAGGLLVLGAVAVDPADGETARDVLIVLACLLAFPLAILTFPCADFRSPVDFVAAVTVGAAGLVGALTATNGDVVAGLSFFTASALVIRIWWRLERGPRHERPGLLWLAVALGAAGLAGGVAAFAGDGTDAGGATAVAVFVVVPAAMVVGRRRPELVDVRGVIVQVVVSAVAMLIYLSVFVGAASAIDQNDQGWNIGALGVLGAVCALGFHPTTVVLRGVVDQLLFGDRPDPLRAATQVADRIGDDPVLALRAIREALVLPYASLRADGRELASSGTAVTHTRTIPLDLGGNSVGEVIVGLRAGDLRLPAADENVLKIVAPLLAQTIRARALAADLQASRGEAIQAIEEERRRLRRDLHDGLGPTLTGVAFATDAARNKLRDDPSGADALLARLRSDTASAITEIRRLVEGLRPPALDELGLVAAVRQQARGMHTSGGTPLRVTIDAPEPMPELPAAAEVAAFRIVVEALTNVARHAASESAHVTLTVGDAGLGIVVDDAGSNGTPWRPGVGMSSMRERAEQVGGSLSAGAGPAGGRVEALIPLT